MSAMTDHAEVVRCDFDGCDSSMTFRVVLAVVDQLGADADIDLTILESLDLPLEDCIAALAPRGIETASVWMGDDVLTIEIQLQAVDDILDTAPLGDMTDVVEAFFDVTFANRPPHARLTVSVG